VVARCLLFQLHWCFLMALLRCLMVQTKPNALRLEQASALRMKRPALARLEPPAVVAPTERHLWCSRQVRCLWPVWRALQAWQGRTPPAWLAATELHRRRCLYYCLRPQSKQVSRRLQGLRQAMPFHCWPVSMPEPV
jgi:hypothetical protein